MAAAKGLADRPILITPRTLVMMAGGIMAGTIGSYIWIFSTFATIAALDAHAMDFQYHVEATTIWQLETRVEDVSDKLWNIAQRIEEPGGNTTENKSKKRDLEKRESKLNKQIHCLQTAGKHCLSKPAPD